MKEELDKIERCLKLGLWVDAPVFVEDSVQPYADVSKNALRLFTGIRPRLEKALRLLEIKELQDNFDDGNEGQSVVR